MRRPTGADIHDSVARIVAEIESIDACLARVSEFLYQLDTHDERDEHRSIPATILERD